MEGWIKLHRRFLEHWLCDEYRPLTKREAWENMLFYANFKDDKALIKGQIIECKRGQICYSLETYSKKFNWSIGQVRQFFKLLENDGMIKVEGMKYTTRLTICKYEEYQVEQQTVNKLTTFSQQTDNILPTTSEEGKEREESKEVYKPKKFITPSLQEIIVYCQERKNKVDAEHFFDHYQANGWKIGGKALMKDWKASVRTWEKNGFNHEKRTSTISATEARKQQEDYGKFKPGDESYARIVHIPE